MVMTPRKPPNNTLARDYIQQLAKGIMPDNRPDSFGEWESVVLNLERVCMRHGTAESVQRALDTLCTQNGALADLMAANVHEQEEEESQPAYPPLPVSAQLPPELSRGACAWLEEYIAFSKKWSPRGYEDYHEAVGLSLLSAVAAHRVSYAYGGMEYTPLYIALIGNTTVFKKTTTAKIYPSLLRAAKLDWIMGANTSTPQKLLSDMSGKYIPSNYSDLAEEDQTRVRKRLAMAGQRGWYYDEFGLQLDQMVKENGAMSDFKGLLRMMDDCMPTFENATVSRGQERIEKPYLSLLASMTPADIKPHAEKNNKFWRDGLFARFAFVCPARGTKATRDRFPDEEMTYPASLIEPLQQWHTWLGEPEIEIVATDKGYAQRVITPLGERQCISTAEVKDAMERYEHALLGIVETDKIHESLYGSYGRLHKIALRVAMLLASFENNGQIEMRHWAKGQEFAEARRRDLHELFAQVNTEESEVVESAASKLENAIYDKFIYLRDVKGVTRQTVAQLKGSYFKNNSTEEIRKACDSMTRETMLICEQTSHSARSGGTYFLPETQSK